MVRTHHELQPHKSAMQKLEICHGQIQMLARTHLLDLYQEKARFHDTFVVVPERRKDRVDTTGQPGVLSSREHPLMTGG